MKRFCFALLLTFLCNYSAQAFETKADYAILIDSKSGDILFEKNAKAKMAPSSMSKMMTAYVVFDFLKKGIVSLNDQYMTSKKAWRMDGSRTFLPLNKNASLVDLLKGLIVQSGNDAAVAIAEGVMGSEDEFVKRMNLVSKELGLSDSNFANSTGMPNEGHYTTAKDLATLAVKTINNFPEHYKLYAEQEFTYNSITQRNRNGLLVRDIGSDGLKTGHTDKAGFGITASAVKGDRRLVVVVNGLKSERARNNEAEKLLRYGFTNFRSVFIAQKGKPIELAEVLYGLESRVPLVSLKDISVSVSNSMIDQVKAKVHYNSPLQAPIKKGQEIAELIVSTPDKTKTFKLVAAKDVGKVGFIKRAFQNLKFYLF